MTKPSDLKLKTETYEWCLKSFRFIEKYFGIHIRVHDEFDAINDGDIFLFNHFARFETVIPAYIFYERFGLFTRTVADHRILRAGERFEEILYSGGAVPNNLDGLLPFLAAEILRGRKVVIFPEGGMIKDRRVIDDDGDYGIFSHTQNIYRKHHKGAAALGIVLELFKQRIRNLFEQEDFERLDHWCEALHITSHEELKRRVMAPTTIVPATITFNPMRIGKNALSNLVKWATKGKAEQFIEEMTVEGNILLKDTDMDVRFNKPYVPKQKRSRWERYLLDRFFLSIKHLDDLFGLKNAADTWSEHLLSRIVEKEIQDLRNYYMEGIYAGITVNITHIAAEVVLSFIQLNRRSVKKDTFMLAVYHAVHQVQKQSAIYLHPEIASSDKTKEIQDGVHKGLLQFLETAQLAKLIRLDNDTFIFENKLSEDHAYHKIRKENPILVCANEARPIPFIHTAANQAVLAAKESIHETLSDWLFEEEVERYHDALTAFSKPIYKKINSKQTAIKKGAPYFLRHKNTSIQTGVLLIHGLTASPAELHSFGHQLHKLGYNVMGVRLAGHGTSAYDLENTTYRDWLDSVKRGYDILAGTVDEVIILGFSTGGTLALEFAAKNPPKLVRVIPVCAPLKIHGKAVPFVPFVSRANRYLRLIHTGLQIRRFVQSEDPKPFVNYKYFPVQSVDELIKLMRQTKKNLKKITTEVCAVQTTKDPVVQSVSALHIRNSLRCSINELHWVESDKHNLVTHNIDKIWELLTELVRRPLSKTSKNEVPTIKDDCHDQSTHLEPRVPPST